MATNENDPRLDELQEDIDDVRRRLPDNPGLTVSDPDVKPVYPSDEETDEEIPPAGTV